MMKTIEMIGARARKPEWSMAKPVDFVMESGEHIAIVGRNGAGKTLFVDMITGRHPAFPDMVRYGFDEPYNNLKYIAFRDTYGGDNDRTYFLQQRWNQMEIDEETPTVGSRLEEAFRLAGDDSPERRALQRHIYDLFHMDGLLDKYIILLSSGELRKLKLAAALFAAPKVLIMDNPFIGLDAETRLQLKELLTRVAKEQQLQLVLVLSKSDEIPPFITHVVEVSEMTVLPKTDRETYLKQRSPFPAHVLDEDVRKLLEERGERKKEERGERREEREYYCRKEERGTPLLSPEGEEKPPLGEVWRGSWFGEGREVVRFCQVSIRYGERTILHNLDWTVNRGEHWVLAGQNGSGKSTLLSLVCADNPQSYACDIRLFGRKRGSGESIWDIKRRIGYVSPEMHRSYQRDYPALHIVASGLKDTVGLYIRPSEHEKAQCLWWMRIFGIEGLANRSFLKMSSGEQRLVLLARAFVKDPELLILDEPLHGLDNYNRQMVKDIIETFCQRPEKTLIFVSHYHEEWPPCIDHELTLQRH